MKQIIQILSLLIILHIVCYSKAFAQSDVSLGVDLSAGVKGFPKYGKRGIGGTLTYFANLWKGGGLRASAGYQWFDHRTPNTADQFWLDSVARYPGRFQDLAFIPLRVGVQQYALKGKASIYAEAGLARFNPGILPAQSVFSFAAGVGGYRFPLGKKQFVQLSLSYNYTGPYKNKIINANILPSHTYLSFSVRYGFQFKDPKK